MLCASHCHVSQEAWQKVKTCVIYAAGKFKTLAQAVQQYTADAM